MVSASWRVRCVDTPWPVANFYCLVAISQPACLSRVCSLLLVWVLHKGCSIASIRRIQFNGIWITAPCFRCLSFGQLSFLVPSISVLSLPSHFALFRVRFSIGSVLLAYMFQIAAPASVVCIHIFRLHPYGLSRMLLLDDTARFQCFWIDPKFRCDPFCNTGVPRDEGISVLYMRE